MVVPKFSAVIVTNEINGLQIGMNPSLSANLSFDDNYLRCGVRHRAARMGHSCRTPRLATRPRFGARTPVPGQLRFTRVERRAQSAEQQQGVVALAPTATRLCRRRLELCPQASAAAGRPAERGDVGSGSQTKSRSRLPIASTRGAGRGRLRQDPTRPEISAATRRHGAYPNVIRVAAAAPRPQASGFPRGAVRQRLASVPMCRELQSCANTTHRCAAELASTPTSLQVFAATRANEPRPRVHNLTGPSLSDFPHSWSAAP
jgi:hypothetical protein